MPFLRKGVKIPALQEAQKAAIVARIGWLTDKDVRVKLGSVLRNDIREYYVRNRFSYLRERLTGLG